MSKQVLAKLSCQAVGEGAFYYRGQNDYVLSRADFVQLEERLVEMLLGLGKSKLDGGGESAAGQKDTQVRLALEGIGEGNFYTWMTSDYLLSRKDFVELEAGLAGVLLKLGHEKLDGKQC